jgi:hypothetical protein
MAAQIRPRLIATASIILTHPYYTIGTSSRSWFHADFFGAGKWFRLTPPAVGEINPAIGYPMTRSNQPCPLVQPLSRPVVAGDPRGEAADRRLAPIPILFSGYTLEKLRRRHGDINFQHYRHMPSSLLQGFVARGRKPTLLDLWWVVRHGSENIGFFVVLKATRQGEVLSKHFTASISRNLAGF